MSDKNLELERRVAAFESLRPDDSGFINGIDSNEIVKSLKEELEAERARSRNLQVELGKREKKFGLDLDGVITEVERERDQLKTALDGLRGQHSEIVRKYEDVLTELTDANKAKTTLSAQLEASRVKMEELRKASRQTTSLQKENAQLLDQIRACADEAKASEELKQQNENLKERVRTVEEKLARSQADLGTLARSKDQIEAALEAQRLAQAELLARGHGSPRAVSGLDGNSDGDNDVVEIVRPRHDFDGRKSLGAGLLMGLGGGSDAVEGLKKKVRALRERLAALGERPDDDEDGASLSSGSGSSSSSNSSSSSSDDDDEVDDSQKGRMLGSMGLLLGAGTSSNADRGMPSSKFEKLKKKLKSAIQKNRTLESEIASLRASKASLASQLELETSLKAKLEAQLASSAAAAPPPVVSPGVSHADISAMASGNAAAIETFKVLLDERNRSEQKARADLATVEAKLAKMEESIKTTDAERAAQLAVKVRETGLLRTQRDELRLSQRREERLLAGAFYDLALRLHDALCRNRQLEDEAKQLRVKLELIREATVGGGVGSIPLTARGGRPGTDPLLSFMSARLANTSTTAVAAHSMHEGGASGHLQNHGAYSSSVSPSQHLPGHHTAPILMNSQRASPSYMATITPNNIASAPLYNNSTPPTSPTSAPVLTSSTIPQHLLGSNNPNGSSTARGGFLSVLSDGSQTDRPAFRAASEYLQQQQHNLMHGIVPSSSFISSSQTNPPATAFMSPAPMSGTPTSNSKPTPGAATAGPDVATAISHAQPTIRPPPGTTPPPSLLTPDAAASGDGNVSARPPPAPSGMLKRVGKASDALAEKLSKLKGTSSRRTADAIAPAEDAASCAPAPTLSGEKPRVPPIVGLNLAASLAALPDQ